MQALFDEKLQEKVIEIHQLKETSEMTMRKVQMEMIEKDLKISQLSQDGRKMQNQASYS